MTTKEFLYWLDGFCQTDSTGTHNTALRIIQNKLRSVSDLGGTNTPYITMLNSNAKNVTLTFKTGYPVKYVNTK